MHEGPGKTNVGLHKKRKSEGYLQHSKTMQVLEECTESVAQNRAEHGHRRTAVITGVEVRELCRAWRKKKKKNKNSTEKTQTARESSCKKKKAHQLMMEHVVI